MLLFILIKLKFVVVVSFMGNFRTPEKITLEFRIGIRSLQCTAAALMAIWSWLG